MCKRNMVRKNVTASIVALALFRLPRGDLLRFRLCRDVEYRYELAKIIVSLVIATRCVGDAPREGLKIRLFVISPR